MLKLRPYKPCDAQTILSWCRDEVSFRRWTADRYPSYPITAADMNRKYFDLNGDCPECDNFYPMTAFDENGVAGHLILRYTDAEKTQLRIGFVIVDDKIRGRGYGKEMLRLALCYAFEVLRAEKVTLGVFDNNLPAYHCYLAAGFRDATADVQESCEIDGERWDIREMEINRSAFAN